MKKLIIILGIIILPMLIYWGLENINKTTEPAVAQAQNGPIVLKFYSEMCLDCKLLAGEIEKINPKYKEQITIKNVDIQANKNKSLIKKYDIKVVPTCVFLDKDSKVKHKQEGFIEKNIFEKYLDNLIDG